MKTLVYHGAGNQSWEDKPDPSIQKPTDVIVKIDRTTICGTDLHIMRGSVPTTKPGRTLGHEGVGTIVEIGNQVQQFHKGDRVLISTITSCGNCPQCKKALYGHCRDGGWMLGNVIDGCQAEYTRIPHADHSLYLVPDGVDLESVVMLSDIFPTGYEVGVLEGNLQPGKTLAIVGAGPVGLAALLTAHLLSPSEIFVIDTNCHRLDVAKTFGATQTISNENGTASEQLLEATNGEGVDVVIEAIGLPVGWEISEQVVCSGGNIAVLGVHGTAVTLHLETMWKKNFTMTAGLVHTYTIPMFLNLLQSGKMDPKRLISHSFPLNDMLKAYDTFLNAPSYQTLKVILSSDPLVDTISVAETTSVFNSD